MIERRRDGQMEACMNKRMDNQWVEQMQELKDEGEKNRVMDGWKYVERRKDRVIDGRTKELTKEGEKKEGKVRSRER